jgi:hypothetical protein
LAEDLLDPVEFEDNVFVEFAFTASFGIFSANKIIFYLAFGRTSIVIVGIVIVTFSYEYFTIATNLFALRVN